MTCPWHAHEANAQPAVGWSGVDQPEERRYDGDLVDDLQLWLLLPGFARAVAAQHIKHAGGSVLNDRGQQLEVSATRSQLRDLLMGHGVGTLHG